MIDIPPLTKNNPACGPCQLACSATLDPKGKLTSEHRFFSPSPSSKNMGLSLVRKQSIPDLMSRQVIEYRQPTTSREVHWRLTIGCLSEMPVAVTSSSHWSMSLRKSDGVFLSFAATASTLFRVSAITSFLVLGSRLINLLREDGTLLIIDSRYSDTASRPLESRLGRFVEGLGGAEQDLRYSGSAHARLSRYRSRVTEPRIRWGVIWVHLGNTCRTSRSCLDRLA